MQKLLIATTNKSKIRELSGFLNDLSLELVSLEEVGINQEVEETGTTYGENSKLKAITYAKLSGLPTLSDDSGLEIAALNGEPGINAKYWAGQEGRDEDLVKKMRQVTQDLPDHNRHAVLKCVITLATPDENFWQTEGSVAGVIAKNPLERLIQGFPYRSFFYLPEINKYYHESELTEAEEKAYNHRYKAIEEIKPIIKKVLNTLSS